MNFEAVLERMADDLRIEKGKTESQLSWTYRIAYSVSVKRGIDALWEKEENGGLDATVSLTHITRTIEQTFRAFYALCPDLEVCVQNYMRRHLREDDSPETVLVKLLQEGGYFYRCPYRAAPTAPVQAELAGVTFLRGLSPGASRNMSGAGMYAEAHTSGHPDDVMNMFRLRKILSGADLDCLGNSLPEHRREHMDGWEFLELSRKNGRYWKNRPDKETSSLARKQQETGKVYTLYQYDGRNFLCRSLPEYWHSGTRYLTLAVALLSQRGTLPPVFVEDQGPLIYLRTGYKLPPAEETFFRLYSWPDMVRKGNPYFNRVMARPVFKAFQLLMIHLGYTFLEESHG